MNMMKRRIWLGFCLLFFVIAVLPAQSLKNNAKDNRPPHRPNPERFIDDKVQFIVRQMNLPAADSLRFVPIYRELQKEKFALMKKRTASVHDLRRRLGKSPEGSIPDSLFLKAVEDEYQYNIEDAKLESAYLEKFRAVLSPRQLYDYLRAEKRFKRNFMNQDVRRHEDRPSPQSPQRR